MNLLPLSLGKLADLADSRGRSASYMATTGIQLRVHGDNTFRAVATDGHHALIVSGPCVDDTAKYPVVQQVKDAPNGELEAVIPADDWKKAFAGAVKMTRKAAQDNPILGSLAVVMGKQVTTLSAQGNGAHTFAQPQNVDGRFPNVAQVIPAPGKALASVRLDGRRLATILDTLTTVAPADEGSVTLEIHANDHGVNLLAFRAAVVNGVRAEGAMTVYRDSPASKKPKAQAEPEPIPAPESIEKHPAYIELKAAYESTMKLLNAALEKEEALERENTELQAELTERDIQAEMGDDQLRKELKTAQDAKDDAEKELAAMEERLDESGYGLDELIDRVAALEHENEYKDNLMAIDARRLTQAWNEVAAIKNAAPKHNTTLGTAAAVLSRENSGSMGITVTPAAPVKRERTPRAVKPTPAATSIPVTRRTYNVKTGQWTAA